MSIPPKSAFQVRVIHRYLGFFLAGIMALYAVSGMVMIFRNTDFLKVETQVNRTLATNLGADGLGQALRLRGLKVERSEGDVDYFPNGTYNRATGEASYVQKELPFVLDRMTHLHKATTNDPLFFMNLFFGMSLLFFVISAFWMYLPGGPILRKGLYFTAGGIVLMLIMLFV